MFYAKKRIISSDENAEKEYPPILPFHETFKVVTFTMSAGMLYPNPKTDSFRFKAILLTYASVVPVSFLILLDMYFSWRIKDIQNIIRHCTVLVPFFVCHGKIYLCYQHRDSAMKIIDEINRDHRLYNRLSKHDKDAIYEHIQQVQFGELSWMIVITCVVLIFPIMAGVQTTYSHIFTAEPKKYMVHDLKIPFRPPEARFESPYFELMNFYMAYCCFLYFFNFVGYDGFFGIAISHACMKMKLYCRNLEEAFKKTEEEEVIRAMAAVIKDQCRVYEFVKTIQTTFNIWLGMIIIATMVHVCNCMYQIMEGIGLDCRYIIFIVVSVVHTYLPCRNASRLKTMSAETATLIYLSGWENVNYQSVHKMVVFMIARAQIPLTITAFNLFTFDMELFVSILQKSYSMFTLLRE